MLGVKVIVRVIISIVVVVVVDTKSPNLEIYAPERVVSATNLLNVAKTGFNVLRIE